MQWAALPVGLRFFLLLSPLLVFFSFPPPSLAASLKLSDTHPQTLSSEDEYEATVTLMINAADGTVYYLRGVFAAEGSTNYCGKTWNGNAWYNGPYSGDGFKHLPSVTVSSAAASLTMKTKLDTQDSGCISSGKYHFKVERYTQSGSGSFDDQNIQTLTVIVPTATPTPTRVPTAVPTSTQAPSPMPTRVPTASLPVTPTDEPEPTEEELVSIPEEEKMVRLAGGITPASTGGAQVLGARDHPTSGSPLIWLLLVGGAASLGTAGYLAFRTYQQRSGGKS